ncbi:MAG: hypothetical protein AB8B91_02400 [Rubripirellula sp.]
MSDKLVPLSDFADAFQAETIRIRLAAAGIQAIVTGTDAAAALSMGGAGSDRLVRVEVARSDFDQAMTLLLEDRERLANAKPWICSRCDEQNEPAFEVCWKCSKPQEEGDRLGRIDVAKEGMAAKAGIVGQVAVDPVNSPDLVRDGNPYRPVLVDAGPGQVMDTVPHEIGEEDRGNVRRAVLASVVGVLLLPPLLTLYGFYLLLGIPAEAYKQQGLRGRLITAWAINSVNLPFWVLYYLGLARS